MRGLEEQNRIQISYLPYQGVCHMPYVILKIFRPEIREIRKHSTHIVISNLIYKHDLSDRKWLRGGECMKDSELLGGRTKWTSRKCILRKEIILKNHFATVHENISTSWVFLKAWIIASPRACYSRRGKRGWAIICLHQTNMLFLSRGCW